MADRQIMTFGYSEYADEFTMGNDYELLQIVKTQAQPNVFMKLINKDNTNGIKYKILGKIVRSGSEDTIVAEKVLSAGDTVLEAHSTKYSYFLLYAKTETADQTPILKVEYNQRS